MKGLGLVHPEEVLLETHGVRENRRFHIVDADGRRFNQLRNGALVQIRPEYDAETTVVADCDLREALHAKRYFDAAGHYGRADVLAPRTPTPPSA